jgi:hypothetical protein
MNRFFAFESIGPKYFGRSKYEHEEEIDENPQIFHFVNPCWKLNYFKTVRNILNHFFRITVSTLRQCVPTKLR